MAQGPMWWNKTAVSVKVPDDNWDKPVPKESKDFRDSTTSRTSMLRIPVNVRATTVHSSPPLRSAAASSLSSFSPPTLSVMPTSGTTTSEAALVRKNVDSQSLQSLQSLQTRVSTLEARLSDLSITLLAVSDQLLRSADNKSKADEKYHKLERRCDDLLRRDEERELEMCRLRHQVRETTGETNKKMIAHRDAIFRWLLMACTPAGLVYRALLGNVLIGRPLRGLCTELRSGHQRILTLTPQAESLTQGVTVPQSAAEQTSLQTSTPLPSIPSLPSVFALNVLESHYT